MQLLLLLSPLIRRQLDPHRPVLVRGILQAQLTRHPLVRPARIKIPQDLHTMPHMSLFHRPAVHRPSFIRSNHILPPHLQTVSSMLQGIHPHRLDGPAECLFGRDGVNAGPVLVMGAPEDQVAGPGAVSPVFFLRGVEAGGMLSGKVVGFEETAGCEGDGGGTAAVVGRDAGRDGDLGEGWFPGAFEKDGSEDEQDDEGGEEDEDEEEEFGAALYEG
ncbi:hypothetical protein V8F33_011132 [Rhypophila sp. PSN 637]